MNLFRHNNNATAHRLKPRQRLQERSCKFISNGKVFDAVMPFVYTTPIETIGETRSTCKRYQRWSIFKTMRASQSQPQVLQSVIALLTNFCSE